MGYYIQETSTGIRLPAKGKVSFLISDGAIILPFSRPEFVDNMICVVENEFFEAAAYAYDYREYMRFINGSHGRKVTWLTHPLAAKLSEYESKQSKPIDEQPTRVRLTADVLYKNGWHYDEAPSPAFIKNGVTLRPSCSYPNGRIDLVSDYDDDSEEFEYLDQIESYLRFRSNHK